MDKTIDVRRRQLLLSSTAAAVGFGSLSSVAVAQTAKSKPLPKYAEWKYIDSVIVHTSNTIETRRAAFGTSVIVPNDILFIRNNLSPPEESIIYDANAWELTVQGVGRPGKMTLGQLKRLGVESVATVLQCSGNGRGFFKHKPSGTPWTVGAAGCVVWSGVPVAAVAKAMGGVAGGMQFMSAITGDRGPNGPRERILRAVQTGIVLSTVGGGCLLLSDMFQYEASDIFRVAGVILLSLGIGFLLAAGAAYGLSKRLGVLQPANLEADSHVSTR